MTIFLATVGVFSLIAFTAALVAVAVTALTVLYPEAWCRIFRHLPLDEAPFTRCVWCLKWL